MKKNRLVLGALSSLVLLGCYDGLNIDYSDNTADKDKTPKELIQQLEDEGKLPVLDRTETLTGVDENDNGVRDDIETYIEMKYPDPELQKLVMKLAAAFQESLTSDHSDRELQRRIAIKGDRAVQCFRYRVKNNPQLGEPYKLGSFIRKSDGELVTRYINPALELEKMTSNTKSRLKAYLMHNKALDGMAFRGLSGDTCDE